MSYSWSRFLLSAAVGTLHLIWHEHNLNAQFPGATEHVRGEEEDGMKMLLWTPTTDLLLWADGHVLSALWPTRGRSGNEDFAEVVYVSKTCGDPQDDQRGFIVFEWMFWCCEKATAWGWWRFNPTCRSLNIVNTLTVEVHVVRLLVKLARHWVQVKPWFKSTWCDMLTSSCLFLENRFVLRTKTVLILFISSILYL